MRQRRNGYGSGWADKWGRFWEELMGGETISRIDYIFKKLFSITN